MRRLGMIVVLGVLVLGAGCKKNNKTQTVSDVPPAPLTDMSAEYSDPVVVPMPEDAPSPAQTARTYTIKRGDTLYSIARREYGDGKRWQDIAAANNITDPQKLAVGMTIVLP